MSSTSTLSLEISPDNEDNVRFDQNLRLLGTSHGINIDGEQAHQENATFKDFFA